MSEQVSRQPYIGGQAVIEGVMMRSPKSFVVAVRRHVGGIAIREQAWGQLLPSLRFLRWPLFRGALVLPFVPRLHANDFVNQLLMVLIKVPMAFPIAGIAYELQRWSAKDSCPAFIKGLTRPGIWLQKITTQPPTDAQQEVALLSLDRALAREEGKPKSPDGVTLYATFEEAAA